MGFFDKMFSGLSKTRKNIEELEEVFRNYDIDDIDSVSYTHLTLPTKRIV